MKVYELQTRKGILIYGFREDKRKVQEIWNLARGYSPGIDKAFKKSHEKGSKACMAIIISREAEKELISPFIKSQHDAEELVFNNNPNIYYWEDFLQHKIIRRCLTARYMKNRLVDMQLPGLELRKKLLYKFKREHDAIEVITKKYYGSAYSYTLHEHFEDLIPEWKEMADRFVAKYSTKIPLIKHMPTYMEEGTEDFKEYVAYLKYKKVRLRNKFYLKTKEQLKEEALQKERSLQYIINLCMLFLTFAGMETKLLTYKTNHNGEDQEGNTTT